MSGPILTEALIRSLATSRSFERGRDYFRSGDVLEVEQRGDTLLAEVEGSGYDPYQVRVRLDAGGIVETDCSCPYDWGGYCKHIVAVLLTYVHQSDRVAERPAVADLLVDLSREALAGLLADLLATHPHLADWVEARVTALQGQQRDQQESDIGPRQRRAPLDPQPFRRQVRNILKSAGWGEDDYWDSDSVVSRLREVVEQAIPFLEAGDGRNALVILESVANEYVHEWYNYDHDGEDSSWLFDEMAGVFAEAILSADLAPGEREDWAEKLDSWQAEFEDYGLEPVFDAAIAAAKLGWDYPPLQRAMQGHVTEQGAWEGEAPWYADELAVARLNVLERQGRVDEYLSLAQAEGQTSLYVTMLVKAGQADKAVAYATEYLTSTDEALALAQVLREHERPHDALRIAEHGLSLHGSAKFLARWLRDLASGLGEGDLALQAARSAYADSPSLEDYQAVQAVAADEWPPIQKELLQHLETVHSTSTKVDIYLHEGMVERAIQAVDRESCPGCGTVERVVDVAWESHPDWTIRHCKAQAEPIMDGGKSKYYHHAVRWLGKARKAYLAADRADEWSAYLEGLIAKHYRKYSLRPQLEALR